MLVFCKITSTSSVRYEAHNHQSPIYDERAAHCGRANGLRTKCGPGATQVHGQIDGTDDQ